MRIKLKNMIEIIELITENPNGGSYKINEKVFYDTLKDVEKTGKNERISYPTDYAVMNGACISSQEIGYKKQKTAWYWFRSAFSDEKVDDYYMNEVIDNDFPVRTMPARAQQYISIFHFIS